MYMETQVNGKPTKALVDTGASHNFITKEEATSLGLSWTEKSGWLMIVNANARRLEGAASNVELRLGTWQGCVNFSVAPMDDFKVVLGVDFLRHVTAIPMPSFSTICILEKGSPCMVPTIEGDSGSPSKQLSAMQLAKGANRGEPTYVAVLKEDNSEGNSPEVLRDNELYVKESKCIFAQEEVNFLGHIVGHERIRMDGAKGYSARAAPLTDLLKKEKPWVWSNECRQAFEDLKVAVSQEPVLALPDFTKPFEVHTDASDFAIGGVLMQERHPIAFESRKLNDTERHYTVQEKEMTAILHCLRLEIALENE
ncbi:Uncharacterized mitochondrial protein AtMg00860 [Striga hermonthica]|uniref:Uncharacterized mitochondrial protein AtMg00860 n=1 Tax=Striga hermonthica TaxID=68872 RepID=A0A9N7R2Z8_STRHE|nr:Uncharacterized mitochondrial protein AtMg00860 [Striga hermonthica]